MAGNIWKKQLYTMPNVQANCLIMALELSGSGIMICLKIHVQY